VCLAMVCPGACVRAACRVVAYFTAPLGWSEGDACGMAAGSQPSWEAVKNLVEQHAGWQVRAGASRACIALRCELGL
jgi:hypothetical protein